MIDDARLDELLQTWKPGEPITLNGSFTQEELYALADEVHRRARKAETCPPRECDNDRCSNVFTPLRTDQKYCRALCRTQQANRDAYARGRGKRGHGRGRRHGRK
jgi:hypothetical protein